MSDELTTYQRLAAPFELSEHARVPKGGMTQTYAPWTAYVERLNDVLGAGHWSFRVIREGFTETECWVLGEITATIDGETVTRQQYGCEPIVKGQRETPTTDLLKTAASDAIKKAASLIGPGLYLSIKEEREAVEAAMREAAKSPKAPGYQGLQHSWPTASRAASTPSASGATPNSSSTAATTAPSTSEPAQAAAELTGASLTRAQLQQRWQRLVSEAERVKLPTLGTVKAIDPKAISERQLKSYADKLEGRIYEIREAEGAA